MSNLSTFEQLDADINALLAGQLLDPSNDTWDDIERTEMLAIADVLRTMPDPAFRARLKADIAAAMPLRTSESADAEVLLPTLFGRNSELYPVHRVSFAASVLLHAAAMVLIVFSSAWLIENRQAVRGEIIALVDDSRSYPLPAAPNKTGGGGGGGDHDRIPASKGQPPKFAAQQITPPTTVARNVAPKLAAEPTVVGPSTFKFPTGIIGDPLSNVTVASNGTGSGSGIGTGEGGGVGTGTGAGVGPGYGSGFGGGVFRVGGGVSAPRAIFDPDPDYSEQARKARYQGTVLLNLIVDPKGNPRNIKVARSLGMGLDEKAIDSVKRWRFQPAMKDGHAVAVQINVEVNFHLY